MVKIKRAYIQFISLILGNSYFKGFKEGTIYQGDLKKICFPGLNCYSCPSAYTSCPIGALQSVALDVQLGLSLYVIGFLALIGTFFGRMVCGWICPFGFIQELLYKIPFWKINIHRVFKYIKYVILAVFVFIGPLIIADTIYTAPLFCKLICPAGTLEAGIPLILMIEDLQSNLGWLFVWKLFILVGVILFSILSKRPFCRVLCPLGAIYGLFNRISIYRLNIDQDKCTTCNNCTRNCPVSHKVYQDANSPECIRCGKCKSVCPEGAINSSFKLIRTEQDTKTIVENNQ